MFICQARLLSEHNNEKITITTKINLTISAVMTLMTVSTLAFTIHSNSIAKATSEQVAQLSNRVDRLQTIQLSQASYAELRLNNLSERLDTNANRLEGRVSVMEARQQMH